MNNFKSITFCLLSSLIGASFGNASNIIDTEKLEGNIIRTACIYQYFDDQDKDADFIFNNGESTVSQLKLKLANQGPIHVNLINRELGDPALMQLIPFADFIHGLSLNENFLTNDSLAHLTKFSELRYLDLANNSFLYPTLDSLSILKNLSYLNLSHNRIKREEIDSLNKKMPNLNIIFE